MEIYVEKLEWKKIGTFNKYWAYIPRVLFTQYREA